MIYHQDLMFISRLRIGVKLLITPKALKAGLHQLQRMPMVF
ncbi:Uncharacterised protein [Mycobacterium tuberculosis]|nr:Uncharacterised protein [Mycobacterium tuberculosis]